MRTLDQINKDIDDTINTLFILSISLELPVEWIREEITDSFQNN